MLTFKNFIFQNHLKHVPEYNVPDNLKRVQKKVSKKKLNKNAPKVKLSQRKQLTKTQEKYRVQYILSMPIFKHLNYLGKYHDHWVTEVCHVCTSDSLYN